MELANKLNDNNSSNVNDEVSGLKEDVNKVLSRLNNLKGHSREIFSQQFSELSNKFNNLRDEGMEKGKEYYSEFEDVVNKNPVKATFYAFAAGAVFAALLRR